MASSGGALKTAILNLDDLTIDSNKNFLIIEDDQNLNECLSEYITLIGFNGEIFSAYSLEQAQNFLENSKIDFIVCDWNLPDGEGFALLKAVRKLKRFSYVPFLMVTGNDDVDYMLKSSKYGVSEYLVKPFQPEELRSKIIESWKHHLIKNESHAKDLEEKLLTLENKITNLEEENSKMRKLLQGLSK